jgi:uncharacterized protein (TIGR00290 family)
MKAFSAWSGGKDCMLALYRTQQQKEHTVTHLVNMCDEESGFSRSHGLKKAVIARQAELLGIKLLQPKTSRSDYEKNFKKVMAGLKEEGVEAGIFGDIYLNEHRDWIERVCRESGIIPVFPLWKVPTIDLAREMIREGFKILTVSVSADHLDQSWLNREFNAEFVNEYSKLEGHKDICAENGEFHSFVYDGPNFKHPVPFTRGKTYFSDNHWFLEID